MEPTRARPVPFWRQSLRPAPLTSLLSLVLCVPARSPRRYHREASWSRCGFTFAPKTASASSTWPTFLPSRLTTSTTGMFFSLTSNFLLKPTGLKTGRYKTKCLLRLLVTLWPHGNCRFADENVLSTWPGHRSPHQQQVFVGVHFHHFQILGGYLLVSHVTWKMLVLPHARWKRTAADTARRAVEHRTVRRVASGVVPALHAALKALAFADAADIHQFAGLETLHQHAVANFGFVFRFAKSHFVKHFHRRDVGLLEMPGHGLVHPLRLDEFDQAQLRRLVAVFVFRAALHHHARAGLQNRAADQAAVFGKDLRHAQLDSDDSVDCHCFVSRFCSMSA